MVTYAWRIVAFRSVLFVLGILACAKALVSLTMEDKKKRRRLKKKGHKKRPLTPIRLQEDEKTSQLDQKCQEADKSSVFECVDRSEKAVTSATAAAADEATSYLLESNGQPCQKCFNCSSSMKAEAKNVTNSTCKTCFMQQQQNTAESYYLKEKVVKPASDQMDCNEFANVIIEELITAAIVRSIKHVSSCDRAEHTGQEPTESNNGSDNIEVKAVADSDVVMDAQAEDLFVHRVYQPETEDLPLSTAEDEEVVDERLEELEHEVSALQECLEIAEAHVDKVEAELLKEKSKVELIEKELVAREKLMSLVIAEKNRQLKEAIARAENAEKMAFDDQLNHQDQLEMYEAKMKEKITELQEKEESNHMLRREMLEIMNKFTNEKTELETRIDDYKTQATVNEKTAKNNSESPELRKRLRQKHTEVKVLQREVVRLRKELEINSRTADRARKIALILDAIDSID